MGICATRWVGEAPTQAWAGCTVGGRVRRKRVLRGALRLIFCMRAHRRPERGGGLVIKPWQACQSARRLPTMRQHRWRQSRSRWAPRRPARLPKSAGALRGSDAGAPHGEGSAGARAWKVLSARPRVKVVARGRRGTTGNHVASVTSSAIGPLSGPIAEFDTSRDPVQELLQNPGVMV